MKRHIWYAPSLRRNPLRHGTDARIPWGASVTVSLYFPGDPRRYASWRADPTNKTPAEVARVAAKKAHDEGDLVRVLVHHQGPHTYTFRVTPTRSVRAVS